MEKRYYIAIVKELRMNGVSYRVVEKVILDLSASSYSTLEYAEKALYNYGNSWTNYTILTEYIITN